MPLDGVVTAISLAIELFQILVCNFDADIYAVEEEATDVILVAGDGRS
ncbi:MAG: hypothetical protein NVSMB27_01660 [Ktedonobacteraceae bacterium]